MLLYLLSLSIGLILAVAIIYIPLRRYGTIAFGLNPVIWFSVFFIILHIAMPVLKFITNTYRYQTEYPIEDVVPYVWCLILSYLVIAAVLSRASGYTFARAIQVRQSIILGKYCYKDRINRLLIFGVVTLIIGAYAAYNNYGQLGEDYLSDRITAGVGRGLETQLPNLLLSAVTIFLYIALKHSKPFKKQSINACILLLVSITFIFSYYSSTSSRNSIFILIILIVAIYGLMKPVAFRLSIPFLRRSLIIGIGLGVALTGFTEITKERYSASGGSYAAAREERLVFFMFDGAFGNDENILWLAANPFEYQLGASYVAAVTNFIPRSIWPEKPLGAGPRIRNAIYPGSYVVGSEGNSSITTGLFTEAFLNFGLPGLFLVPIIWAYIAIKFARKVARNLGSALMLPWAVALVLWSTALMYSEFLGFLSRFLFITLPLFAAAIFSVRCVSITDRHLSGAMANCALRRI